ncbi:unnamed protein product [Cylicocyclus nassatus]|uniref:Uncharacterized protein n=1 Tax=Cylicocyclus nassatus TaxID=53992 RepID=A0AA36M5H6_CYLNA|nr:unnamed protein product [Cylicocyclus nassatus]
MFSMMSNAESSPTTSSPFGFGSSSASPFSAPQTPDLEDERSIYMSPTPVSRSLKADNVKEIYFKAYVDEKLEVHKKELEEELHQGRMRALEQALEDAKKESWMYKPLDF